MGSRGLRQARVLVALTLLTGLATLSTAAVGARAGSRSVAVGSRTPSHHQAHEPHTPLRGTTVGIDPGHNGRNYTDPTFIDHKIWNGREYESCNTTGTATNGGYPEARFTYRVARDLRHDLRAKGARVVMTRHNNHGVGPCVNRRAQIINHAHADVGIDIHGDGGPSSGRGFAVLEPVKDKENRRVLGGSATFGRMLRHSILAHTSMPTSTYDGTRGITHRDDLAGLNLTRVPLVLIESGNMRNSTDARLMVSTHWQHRLAHAFADAITRFLDRHHH